MPPQDRNDANIPVEADEIAKRMKIDPDLVRQAGPEAVPVLAGVQFYRQLRPAEQTTVLKALAALEQDHPELAQQLRSRHADIVVRPQWHHWSLSDKELDQAVQHNEKIANTLWALGVGSAVGGEMAKPRAPGAAGRVGWGGVAFGATLGVIANGVTDQISRLKDEKGRRGLKPTGVQ